MKRSDLPEHLRDLWNPADLEDGPRRPPPERIATKVGLRDQVGYSLAFLGRGDVRVVDVLADDSRAVVLVLLDGTLTRAQREELVESVRAVAPAHILLRVVDTTGEDLAALEAAWRLGGVEALDAIDSAIRLGGDPVSTAHAFVLDLAPER